MWIISSLLQQIRTWDRPSRYALLLALMLLPVLLALIAVGPETTRNPALIGAALLLLSIQGIVMWGNRGLVTPYTQAQRLFLAGDMIAARDVLESVFAEHAANDERPGVDHYVLLGNVYRNLGELHRSEELLRNAVIIKQNHHFSLYNLGRTLLAKGQYNEAADYITSALTVGAPEVAYFDLGHARYRLGDYDGAHTHLERVLRIQKLSAPRLVMAQYLLSKYGVKTDYRMEAIQEGLVFWEAEAQRFADTPYGQALLEDIQTLKTYREGS